MRNEFITSENLAEVQAVYKNKVKAADRPKIEKSDDVVNCLRAVWNDDSIEHVEEAVMLLLNKNNKVLGWVKLSSGGVAGTVVDPKVIFQFALKTNASAIILSHNHPSGNLKPSNDDIKITNKIKTAGDFLDIKLLDHIIITADSHYSMADNGDF